MCDAQCLSGKAIRVGIVWGGVKEALERPKADGMTLGHMCD